MKTAVVDVGGGLRGIYSAGILDYCLDRGIHFDLGIGVSAGAANLSSYIARQKGRNYCFYRDYSGREEYMSFKNLKEKKKFLDLDYIYHTLSVHDGENPLDYKALQKSDQEFLIVATNAITGKPAYFPKESLHQDEYAPIAASCSIPIVCEPRIIKNVPFFDGALSDPIPIEKAFEEGADRVVLILTKPVETHRLPYKDSTLSLLMKKWPKAARQLRSRADKYNRTVELAHQYEKEGKLLIVSPDDTCGVDTLTRDPAALHNLYLKGYLDGQKVESFLNRQQETAETKAE